MDAINPQSFCASVKEEIASLSFSKEEARSLLSGFTKCNGSFRISGGKETLDLSTESSKIAAMLYKIILGLYSIQCHFGYTRGMGSRKAMRYHVYVPSCQVVLDDIQVAFAKSVLERHSRCLVGFNLYGFRSLSFISWVNLGYVSDARNKNYHLEFSLSDKTYALWLSHLINKALDGNFDSKIVERRKKSVVYFKKGEKISEFLVYLRAQQSCLEFESIRVDRDFANIGNRLRNLDGANTRKKEEAAKTQLAEIEYLLSSSAFSQIQNPKIPILCELRRQNPEASMEMLAELLSEEIGMSVSKSNINHLFRTIHELYKKEIGK